MLKVFYPNDLRIKKNCTHKFGSTINDIYFVRKFWYFGHFLKKILKWRMEQEIIRTDQELARIGGINYSIYKIYKFSYF